MITYSEYKDKLKSGDMIGFDSRESIMAKLIKLVTKGDISHVGVVLKVGDQILFYESRRKEGCRSIELSKIMNSTKNNGRDLKLYVYPLKTKLSDKENESFMNDLNSQLGKTYSELQAFISAFDHYFINLLAKVGLKFTRSTKLYNKKLFCSKLVTVALQKVGIIDKNIVPRHQTPVEVSKLDCFLSRIQVVRDK